jgi:hypothetical protein
VECGMLTSVRGLSTILAFERRPALVSMDQMPQPSALLTGRLVAWGSSSPQGACRYLTPRPATQERLPNSDRSEPAVP